MQDIDSPEITDPATRELLDLPPLPAPVGRPAAFEPSTFDEAMKSLKPQEAEFVRHVIGGASYADAYRKVAPAPVTDRTAQVNASKMAKRQAVKAALSLGKEAGGANAIAGVVYDAQAAHAELETRIEAADKAGQHTAVANMLNLKMKLHALLIERAQIEQASLVVNIAGVDTSRLINPAKEFPNG
ncbi:MAG TPA: hypothetical protein VHB46_04475 [Burkholderiales bacterium]|nr:hypothetical protein [Burkholderiales bacterium]